MRRSWIFFVAAFVAYDLVWIWQVVMLPVRVPRHWDALGHPDHTTFRTEPLAQSALLGLALTGLFIVLAWAVTQGRLERLRIDALAGWSRPERRELRRRLLEDVWVVGGITLGCATAHEVIRLPALHTSVSGLSVLVLLVLYVALVAAWCVGAYRSRYAAPPAPEGSERDVARHLP